MPCIAPPSSWRSTSCGLIALPTSAHGRRATSPRRGRCRARPRPRRPRRRPPRRPGPRRTSRCALAGSDLALTDQLAAGEPEARSRSARGRSRSGSARSRRPSRTPALRARRPTPRAAVASRRSRMSAAARCTARPASVVERLAPVERSYGVKRVSAPCTVTRSASMRELLGGDLREHRARALAHLGRADDHLDAAVGLHPHDWRARPGARRRRAARPTRPRPVHGGLGSPQPIAAATFSTSPDEVGVERLAAGPDLLARAAAGSGGAARAGRCRRAARPRRPGARRSTAGGSRRRRGRSRRARCSCRRSCASTRTASQRYGPGAASPAGGADARPVVGVGAGVEPELDARASRRAVRAVPPSASGAACRGGASSPSTPRRGSGSAPAAPPCGRAPP